MATPVTVELAERPPAPPVAHASFVEESQPSRRVDDVVDLGAFDSDSSDDAPAQQRDHRKSFAATALEKSLVMPWLMSYDANMELDEVNEESTRGGHHARSSLDICVVRSSLIAHRSGGGAPCSTPLLHPRLPRVPHFSSSPLHLPPFSPISRSLALCSRRMSPTLKRDSSVRTTVSETIKICLL